MFAIHLYYHWYFESKINATQSLNFFKSCFRIKADTTKQRNQTILKFQKKICICTCNVLTHGCFISVIFFPLLAGLGIDLILFSFKKLLSCLKNLFLKKLPTLVDLFTLHLFSLQISLRIYIYNPFFFRALATHNYFFVLTMLASRPHVGFMFSFNLDQKRGRQNCFC